MVLFLAGGHTVSAPRGPCTTIHQGIHIWFVQASGQSLSVMLTLRGNSSDVDCEHLKKQHRVQLIC